MNIQPLPQRPAPLPDELLSSWIARLADANHCSVPELCRYLGFDGEHPPETLAELQGENIERFCAISRLSRSDLKGMLLARRAEFPVQCMSWSDFQHCPVCTRETPGVSLCHWRYTWSLVCKSCGSELLPIRASSGNEQQVSPRLLTRAIEGACQLEQAYRCGNCRQARRVDLIMQVVGIFEYKLHHAALFSKDRHHRYAMLAALYLGMSRPMLAAALALRNDPAAETRLRVAFPHQRKLLVRLVRRAGGLLSRRVEKRKDQFPRQRAAIMITAGPEYLTAARNAIDRLGETADRGDLLQCAERILESSRQQPVDIS